MFRIGEFSRFSRVSVKMLRHYDKVGLLSPAWVDPATGYRYYRAEQLLRLNRLVALKDLGFRLEQIAGLLDEAVSTEQIRGMLKLRRAELEATLQETVAQLAQVEARLAQFEQTESPPRDDVVLRASAPQMMASIRQPVGGDDVTALFEELETYVARQRTRAPLPPLLIYHDGEFSEQAEEVEVLVPIQKPLPPHGRIASCELPGHEMMACLIHTGGYEGLPHAFAVLLGWIERNGFTIVGPVRELYLCFGADQQDYTLPEAYLTQHATEFVTELQIPVASGKAESRK
jgi:DNA-binding transcriptional MerR regulator